MAKPEWGVKRQCASCGARFYDLLHDPITCPECGTVFEVAALLRGKRPRPGAGRAEAVKKAVLVEEADELDLVDVDIEDADVEDDDVVLDEEADEADDVPVSSAAPGVDVEDEDDALDTDDTVLIEDEDDDAVPLDEFEADEEDDDTRR